MQNELSLKKTPLMVALGAALAVSMTAPALAEEQTTSDEEVQESINGNDTQKEVWECTDGNCVIIAGDGKGTVEVVDRKVELKDDATMKAHLTVSGTASFTVDSGETLTLEDGKNLTVALERETADDKVVAGSFVNKGKIVLQSGSHTIDDFEIAQADADAGKEMKDLPTISMGDLTLKNGAHLTNSNTGYTTKEEIKSEEKAEEKKYESVEETLVTFGQVLLEGSKFETATGARDSGKSLTLKGSIKEGEATGSGSEVVFNGTSEWEGLTIDTSPVVIEKPDAGTEGQTTLEGDGAEGDTTAPGPILSTVTVGDKADVKIGSLTIKGKLEQKSLFEDVILLTDSSADGQRTETDVKPNLKLGGISLNHEGELTIKNPEERVDLSEAGIVLSSAVTADRLKAEKVDLASKSSLEVTEFTGRLVKKPEDSTEEGGKDDETPNAKSRETTGEEGTEPKFTHEWKAGKLGSIRVSGLSQLTFKDNAAADAKLADGESFDPKASDLFADGEAVALRVASDVTFADTWAYATETRWKAKEAAEGDKPETREDAPEQQTSMDRHDKDLNRGDGVQILNQKIENSDLLVDGTFGILTEENSKEMTKVHFDVVVTGEDDKVGKDLPEDFDKNKYEQVNKKEDVSENCFQQTTQHVTVENSHLQAKGLVLQSGELKFDNSRAAFAQVEKIGGKLIFTGQNGDYLALGALPTEDDLKTEGTQVFVGQTIVLGEGAEVYLGETPAGQKEGETGGEGTVTKADPARLEIADTTLVISTNSFRNGALFVAEPDADNRVVIGDNAKIDASDLSWGTYALFENFEQVDGNLTVDIQEEGKESPNQYWLVNVKDAELAGRYDTEKGILQVGIRKDDGTVDTSARALGLKLDGMNLVDNVFVNGERNTAHGDIAFISNAMSFVGHEKVKGGEEHYDANWFADVMNHATAFAAASAVKSLAVDFNSYVVDQIEHHAATIPHQMRGWWAQPIGARMKTDDLKAGSLTTGYSLDTTGIMGGWDTTLPGGDIWGIAASYQTGDADGEADASDMTTEIKNIGFHLWATRHIGDLQVMGTLSYMTTEGEAEMATPVGKLESDDISAKALSFGVNAALTKNFGAFTIIPHAGARVSAVEMDEFSVNYGGREAFRMEEDRTWLFEVPVGATFQTAFEYQRWNVVPYVDVTLRGRFGDTDSSYTVSGASGAASDRIDYDVTGNFVGDVKLGYMSTFKNLNLGMSYGFSAGDAGRQNHRIEATMRVNLWN